MKNAKVLISIGSIILGFFITGFSVHSQIMGQIDEKIIQMSSNTMSKERGVAIEKMIDAMDERFDKRLSVIEQDIKKILLNTGKGKE